MDTAATDQTLVIALAHVAGFARSCEGRANVEVFDTLSNYYSLAQRFAAVAGGRVVKYMGDGVLFVFPERAATSAMNALQEFRSAASELWHNVDSTCVVEVNSHVGRVAAGDFGVGVNRRFDVVGKPVNELFMMPWDGFQMSTGLRTLLDSWS